MVNAVFHIEKTLTIKMLNANCQIKKQINNTKV